MKTEAGRIAGVEEIETVINMSRPGDAGTSTIVRWRPKSHGEGIRFLLSNGWLRCENPVFFQKSGEFAHWNSISKVFYFG